MKRTLLAIAIAVLSINPSVAGVADAVADPTRLDEHKARDEHRKPETILALADVKAGDKVADLAAGSGYFTALLSRIVGESGKVYAVDPTRIFEAFPNAANAFPAFMEKDPRGNVDYSVQKLDEIKFGEPLDVIIMGLYYHDTMWTGTDRTAMNKAMLDALKPGGAYLIIDHNAAEDADASVTKDLHRMTRGVVKPEVMAAGFALEAESDALASADDRFAESVFTEDLRGKTDRFVYLFRKP